MKLEDLYKKYPFIYEVNNVYYYLGWGICKICDSEIALSYYRKYKNCIQSIGSEVLAGNKEIDDGQLDQLLYYFRKVKAYSDIATDEKEMSSFRNDITQFLNHLKEEEKNMLYVQLTDFVNTFHYYYRRCVK